MVAKVLPLEVARAKALRPSDSGVFRAVHAPEGAANDGGSQSLHPVPEQRVSTRRAGLQRVLAGMLTAALRMDGLADADAASACDRSRPHVADMRSPGGRAITLADAVLLAKVSPSFRTALVVLIEGGQ